MIAAAFVVGMKWLFGEVPNLMNVFARSKVIQHLDKVSIYVYICHERTFGLLTWSIPMTVSFVLMILCVVVLSTILCYFGEFLTKRIDRAVDFLFI